MRVFIFNSGKLGNIFFNCSHIKCIIQDILYHSVLNLTTISLVNANIKYFLKSYNHNLLYSFEKPGYDICF